MGCAGPVRPLAGQEANLDAVQPGRDPVDDDRDRDGREDQRAQDRAGVGEPRGDRQVEHGEGGEDRDPDHERHWCLVGGPRGVELVGSACSRKCGVVDMVVLLGV